MPDDNVIRIRLSLKGRPLKSYTFDKDVITVGRSHEADIVLDNSSISRVHLRFERMPNGHYSVRDLYSSNGTFLNDERIQNALVYNNDVIRIGKFSLWISLERDRRATSSEHQGPSADSTQGTVMLSPHELDQMMSMSREREIVPPPVDAKPERSARPPLTVDHRQSRIATLVAMGLALILATSVGAAAAWLLIR